MHVVATAGHVDHGKSTLVRALTGSDPDRLAEERRRGLSIELGYCWTRWGETGDVAFVDVPGHERFLTTTLAGMGPVPVAMLVVAADDPWMPQAAEHLAALDALGVEHGVLVVTRSDLADPEPALARARAEVDATSLSGCPSVVVSGRTGAGLNRLRSALAGVLAAVAAPDPGADVRLWVDRVFHVRGTGTVVTCTLPAGTIAAGDTLTVDDEPVGVRRLEALGTERSTISGVARIALDLGGRAPEQLGRGSVLSTPRAFLAVTTVDVALDGPSRVPERPLLHVGATSVAVHARPLADGLCRLTLSHPQPLRVGDRAVLRDPGDRRLWGVRVLDPVPPTLGRRGAAAARAAALRRYDGTPAAELALRGIARRSDLRRAGVPLARLPADAVSAGDWIVAPAVAVRLRCELVEEVRRSQPPGAGLTPQAAAHALELPDPALAAALITPPLHLDGGRIVDARTGLPGNARKALEGLRAELDDNPFAAPDAGRLADLGLDPVTVAVLHREGHAVRVADDVVLLAGVEEFAIAVLEQLSQPFTASEARRAWNTSRRVALPLLRHLDDAGRTVRLPDDRRRLCDSATASS